MSGFEPFYATLQREFIAKNSDKAMRKLKIVLSIARNLTINNKQKLRIKKLKNS